MNVSTELFSNSMIPYESVDTIIDFAEERMVAAHSTYGRSIGRVFAENVVHHFHRASSIVLS